MEEDKKQMTPEERSLEERMLAYRSATDYRLPKHSYVLVMIDGKNFSRKIKKSFNLPFDDRFIGVMNETCEYLCSEIQGAKFGYVQSDEISIFLTDIGGENTGAFFDYRLCKICSIVAAMASSFFTMKMHEITGENKLYEFDCKTWTVPTFNEVINWILFRNIDCVRNSKQQTAQTYLLHKALLGKTTDEQISILLETKRIDWNTFDSGKKYGRLIYREEIPMTREFKGETISYNRHKWVSHTITEPLFSKEGRDAFYKLVEERNLIPQKDEERDISD